MFVLNVQCENGEMWFAFSLCSIGEQTLVAIQMFYSYANSEAIFGDASQMLSHTIKSVIILETGRVSIEFYSFLLL